MRRIAYSIIHSPRCALTRHFGVLDTVSGMMTNRAAASKDKAFAAEVTRLLEKPKYTFADFRETLQSGVGGSWRSYLPGGNSDAQKAVKAQLAIIDHCTPDELANPARALRGSRKQRLQDASGASREEVSDLMQQFDHISLMQRWLYKRKLEGLDPPTTEEHLQNLIRQNPQSLNAAMTKQGRKRRQGRRG